MEHHATALEHDDRLEFQLERLILFTDAVFAIAITLLIIEIKVPEFAHQPTNQQIGQALLNLLPRFIGFFISFLVIARYWMAHHRIFRYVRAYNERLIWLNIWFLMTIVLMPFTTALYSNYGASRVAFLVFSFSIVLSGIMQLVMQRYLCNPRHGLIRVSDARHPDLHPVTPLVPVVGFSLAAIGSLFVTGIYYTWLPFLLLPLILLRNRVQKRLVERQQRRRLVGN